MRSFRLIESAQLEELHTQAYSWALTCVNGRRAEAHDVLQTVYLEILEGRARFDGRSELRTWLFGVIRNTARSSWRRARRESQRLLRLSGYGSDSDGGGAPNPIDMIARDGTSARVMAAWRELPARQREVLDLVFYRELSIAEAAQILGVSVGTARQHYERAKSRLRERLSS